MRADVLALRSPCEVDAFEVVPHRALVTHDPLGDLPRAVSLGTCPADLLVVRISAFRWEVRGGVRCPFLSSHRLRRGVRRPLPGRWLIRLSRAASAIPGRRSATKLVAVQVVRSPTAVAGDRLRSRAQRPMTLAAFYEGQPLRTRWAAETLSFVPDPDALRREQRAADVTADSPFVVPAHAVGAVSGFWDIHIAVDMWCGEKADRRRSSRHRPSQGFVVLRQQGGGERAVK